MIDRLNNILRGRKYMLYFIWYFKNQNKKGERMQSKAEKEFIKELRKLAKYHKQIENKKSKLFKNAK